MLGKLSGEAIGSGVGIGNVVESGSGVGIGIWEAHRDLIVVECVSVHGGEFSTICVVGDFVMATDCRIFCDGVGSGADRSGHICCHTCRICRICRTCRIYHSLFRNPCLRVDRLQNLGSP